ncbi:MAG: hypothetical protein JNL94_13955 [Planctomycetes bacterium]|nr:hypothetical protein [Planctomycetota bacterium]
MKFHRLADAAVGFAVAAYCLSTVPRGALFPVHLAWVGVSVAVGLVLPWPRWIDARFAFSLAALGVPVLRWLHVVDGAPTTNADELRHLFACLPAAVFCGVLLRARFDAHALDVGTALRSWCDAMFGAASASAVFFAARSSPWHCEHWELVAAVIVVWLAERPRVVNPPCRTEPTPRELGAMIAAGGFGVAVGIHWGSELQLMYGVRAATLSLDPARIVALLAIAGVAVGMGRIVRPSRRPVSAMAGWWLATFAVLWTLHELRPWRMTLRADAFELDRVESVVGWIVSTGGWAAGFGMATLAVLQVRSPEFAPSRRLAALLCGAAIGVLLWHGNHGGCVIDPFFNEAIQVVLAASAAFAVSDWWITQRWGALLLVQLGLLGLAAAALAAG